MAIIPISAHSLFFYRAHIGQPGYFIKHFTKSIYYLHYLEGKAGLKHHYVGLSIMDTEMLSTLLSSVKDLSGCILVEEPQYVLISNAY